MKEKNDKRVSVLKRRLASVIALVLFLTSVTSFFGDSIFTAFGATLDFKTALTSGLKVGTSNKTPVEFHNGVPQDQITLNWNFDLFDNGTFTLEYPVADGKRITFTIDKNMAQADVKYKVERLEGATWTPIENITSYGSLGFAVHTDVGANGGERFLPIGQFLVGGHNGDNTVTDYRVTSFEVAHPSTPLPTNANDSRFAKLPPNFTIKAGSGFSFKYDNFTVHFKWNEDNTFTYSILPSSAGINLQGQLIPFTLKGTSSSGTTSAGPLWVLTGFDTQNIVVTPTANDGKTDAYILDMSTDPPRDRHPGSDEVGLIMEIPIPKAWDGTAFDAESTVSLPISVFLGNVDVSKQIQINLGDIRDFVDGGQDYDAPTPNVITVSPAGTATSPTCNVKRVGDKIVLTLGNLEPNLIFHETSISLMGGTTLSSKKTVLPFGKVFTFPKYEIVEENGSLYAVVEPYKGYAGYFLLKSDYGNSPLYPAAIHPNDGTKPTRFLLSRDPGSHPYMHYQIFFQNVPFHNDEESDSSIYSQILYYKAVSGDPIVSTPTIFQVLSHTMLPAPGDYTGETATVDVELTWDLGARSVVEKLLKNAGDTLVVKYNLNQSSTPDSTTQDFLLKEMTLTVVSGGAITLSYRDDAGQLVQTTATLRAVNDVYMVTATVGFSAAFKEAEKVNPDNYELEYPNIYFLNLKPVEMNGKPISVGTSLYDDLTLSNLQKWNVPPPQDLNITNPVTTTAGQYGETVDEVSFILSWVFPGAKINEYLRNAYNLPADKADVYMDFYISQDEALLRDKFSKYGPTSIDVEADVNSIDRIAKSAVIPYKDSYGKEALYFSQIKPGVTVMSVSGSAKSPLDHLRNNEVLMIKDFTATSGALSLSSIKFDGLDKNQKYYVLADISVTHRDTGENFKIRVDSIFSNLAGTTTKGDKEVPSPDEKIPATPIIKNKDVGMNEATVYWEWDASYVPSLDETFEYELFRIKTRPLPTEYLDDRRTFDQGLWDDIVASCNEPVKILEYKGGVLTNYDPAKFIYDPDTKTVVDISLFPNQIYFYYVRAVQITDDNKDIGNRSVWNFTTLTTTTVKSPKNLVAETARTDYEPKTEIWISFDAPLTDLGLLGNGISLQYQLKAEGEDWGEHVTMDPATLRQHYSEGKEDDFTHFLYKITGLKPGTGYTIRVRMIDSNGDASLYSNVAQFRTDLDQEEYDKDKESQDWLDFLEQQIQKLIKDPYWLTRNTDSELEVVYRPTMFDALLSQSADGQFTLVKGNQDRAVYYLPASAIASLNSQQKGIKITKDDMDIILSPNFLDPSANEALLSIADKLKNKSIKDYFIKITVVWTNMRDSVEGEEPISKQAELSIEAVGTKTTIVEWDAAIYKTLAASISNDSGMSEFKKSFRQKIDSKTSNEDLVKYVDTLVSSMGNNYMSTVSTQLNQTTDVTYPVTALDKAVIIVAKGIDETATVSGYQREGGQWVPKEVVPYGNGRGMYSKYPGTFIFTGRIIKIPGIENMPGAGQATGIVAKYGLDDFFGKGDSFNLEANTSRHMLISSIARMAGAPKGSDAAAWLRQNGITVPSRNMTADIPTQEAVYLVMSLYEAKTNTSIERLRITNFNQTSGIQGMNDRYKQYIRAAFQLGIYTNTSMVPNGPILVKDVLQMLTALDSKIKL